MGADKPGGEMNSDHKITKLWGSPEPQSCVVSTANHFFQVPEHLAAGTYGWKLPMAQCSFSPGWPALMM